MGYSEFSGFSKLGIEVRVSKISLSKTKKHILSINAPINKRYIAISQERKNYCE